MSFYKKVTQNLLPNAVHHHHHRQNSSTSTDNEDDLASVRSRSTYQSLSGRLNYDDDDSDDEDDLAKLEDGNFFTGLLNTTTVCSGLGTLNNLKKQYLDEFIKKSGLHQLRPQNSQSHHHHHINSQASGQSSDTKDPINRIQELNLYDSSEETSETESDDEYFENESNEKPEETEEEEVIADDLEPTKTTTTTTTSQTTSTATSTATPTSTLAEETTTSVAAVKIPEEHLKDLNPLQRSVVSNLDPHSIKEGILIKVKTSPDNNNQIDNESQILQQKIHLRLKIADKLQRVFDLSDDDQFIGNYSAWLIKDVLLQGHLYLTKDALLYFAFLPKRFSFLHASEVLETDDSSNIVHKGTLGFKSGKYTEAIINAVTTHRYWAVLRSETLSIYSSSTDLYFPELVIDIKNCLYAEIIDKEKAGREALSPVNRGAFSPNGGSSGASTPRSATLEDTASELNSMLSGDTFTPTEDNVENGSSDVWFKLVTKKKTYKFHCDSSFSARQWCNNITKLIFQHNNANANSEVLIKIPISNVLEYNKRTLFSEEEDDDIDDSRNDIPLNLSIKYLSTTNSINDEDRKRDKVKKKMKGGEPVMEEVHFLFPKNGVEFFDAFDKVMNSSDKSDTASQVSRKASIASQKTMSTLVPSNNSLVQTVLDFNKADTDYDDSSTLKKLGKTITSPANIFRPSSPFSSKDKGGIDSITSRDSFENESHLQLPRALSEKGLKSLEISFVTSLKKMEEAATRYDKPHFLPTDLPLPTKLGEPTSEKKDNKKKSISKSIKALYNVGSRWSASPAHYVKDDKYFVEKEEEREESQRNFQEHFSTNSKLLASYYGHLIKTFPVYGKFYVSDSEVCFRSLLPGVSTKMVLPLLDIQEVNTSTGSKLTYHGLSLVLRGAEALAVEFGSSKARDDFQETVLGQLEILHANENFRPQPHEWGSNYDIELSKTRMEYTDSERRELQSVDKGSTDVLLAEQRIELARVRMFEDRLMAASGLDVPIILEDSPFFKTEMRPSTSYNITLLTIGSRGDVQPYIALGKGLIREGHKVTIATHEEFGDWIKKNGLNFKEIAGNPAELMSFMVTHSTMSVGFLKDAQQRFKSWIAKLLTTSWAACQGSDILIESPSAMSGIHIAEALGIPYFRAFTMPWTRTRAYPHAFFVPDQKKGGSYNYLTHVLFENIFWKGISGQVNKWRVEELGLPKTNLYRLQQTRVPFLYNVSPTVLPPAVDFPDWIQVTGYWFLDEGSGDYKPPAELVKFMNDAAYDGKKIVYIGFGSIVVKDAKSLTKAVVEAVKRADVRCILNKGWSDRLDKKDQNEIEVELPPEIYNSGAIPHDWLFPRIDAAVHHGGSGTTGATLRAGTPSIIKPFFGDQFFYATRVEDLGAGLALRKLTAKTLGNALVTVTEDLKIIEKAKRVSEKIKHEHGVLSAIEAIYSELEYSRNLILVKDLHNQNYRRHHHAVSGVQTPAYDSDSDDDDDDTEDDYTEEEEEDEKEDDRDDGTEKSV